MTGRDLVTVVVPVYQGERLVEGALASVLRQTHRALEVIVVDDGSTDRSLERVRTIDDPRVVVIEQANAGTAAARNAALARARGAFVGFLDCDDRWFPEKIEAELAVLREQSPAVGIAYSSYFAVDERGRLLNRARRRDLRGDAFDALLDGEDFLMPSVCLFDRRIFDEIGTFNVGSYHEDHEFLLRATRRYPVFPSGRRLVVYRQSTEGKCRSILADFERARTEELATIGFVDDLLSTDERRRLRENAIRSLSFRFLMYGFDEHARRMLAELGPTELRTGAKGWFTWLFARSGLNLLRAARVAIQGLHLLLLQGSWNRTLGRVQLDLRYD